MTWTRLACTLAVLALGLAPACTDDGENETGAESGSNNETSAGTADSSGDDSAALGCAADIVGETSDGATDPLMETWGAPCTSDAECVALIGEGAVCDGMAVVYELPGGYCTKPCQLPDLNTRFVLDDPACDPNGGVACVGSMGTFERCGLLCTDDQQCNRGGYICRQFPLIAEADDPKMCLMPDCCLEGCASE